MVKREIKEIRVFLVSRESRDTRVTLDILDFLDNLAFQVLMDRREREDCRVFLASQVQRVLWGTLDLKENLETEDSPERKVMTALLVPLALKFGSKETLVSQEFKVCLDLRGQLGSRD